MATAMVDTMSVQEHTTATSPLRKRRRRAPTTGAAEDCHTCRKRDTKCDRRRPYCSQCLEIGKDCSGYRTTLTWGVGVASRGKLRGLSLPIAKPQASPQMSPPKRDCAGPPTPGIPQSAKRNRSESESGPGKRAKLTPLKTRSGNENPRQAPATTGPYPNISSEISWQIPTFSPNQSTTPDQHPSSNVHFHDRRPDLFPLHTSTGAHFGTLPWSTSGSSPISSTSTVNFAESMQYPSTTWPQTSASYSLMDPQHTLTATSPPFSMQQTRVDPSYGQQMMRPHYSPKLERHHSYDQQSRADTNADMSQHFPDTAGPLDSSFGFVDQIRPELQRTYSAPVVGAINDIGYVKNEPDEDPSDLDSTDIIEIPRPSHELQLKNVTPRMQYLIDYYDRAICPVLVAFDGPENPYRKHIVHLAMHNPGLQNALAALATNNMRMRGLKTVPDLSNQSPANKAIMSAAIGMPTPEEQHYKAMSIDYLNSQLANTGNAKGDSVLATLLILCLFHVCDSGFSKFKTQLAGVQKLLRMREKSSQSEFIGWVEMFFAWFDVMTAAVNDRETQIQGESLDLMDLSNNLGPVEEFSGCDGKLFKLIARLGRLNLLSQNRPVKPLPESAFRDAPQLPARPLKQLATRDFYSLQDDHLDATGWSSLFTTPPPPNLSEPPEASDGRHAFWQEWRELRTRLHEWQLDSQSFPGDEPHSLPVPQLHMLHMSESFRWSALLYTERLAHPSYPSTASNIQSLVSKALAHIRDIGVNSCVTKFMLWPLFITGTECVTAEQRELIRARCIEIQKESGFYNNVSGLDLLERVWREMDDETTSHPKPCGSQAFKWRSAMNRVDGEYIVI